MKDYLFKLAQRKGWLAEENSFAERLPNENVSGPSKTCQSDVEVHTAVHLSEPHYLYIKNNFLTFTDIQNTLDQV